MYVLGRPRCFLWGWKYPGLNSAQAVETVSMGGLDATPGAVSTRERSSVREMEPGSMGDMDANPGDAERPHLKEGANDAAKTTRGA